MKKQFLKIAGVKTEDEFYNKYPSEEDFFKAHPEALKQLARGGEAFPQIATMDNFFTYGSPAPPTYYAHGGTFPMAQSEEQFFSPYYGNIPNPYNKAMGGSAYPQSMSFPYGDTGPSTHFMMQDGGYMPEEEPLPRMGVKGYLTDFIGAVKNTAAKKINDNLALHGAVKNPEQYDFEQARYGGNLKSYQSQNTQANTDNSNSDKGTSGSGVVNNYYYGTQGNAQQLPPEYQNDIDYLYGRSRPRSDFGIKGKGMFGNYRSTGWLKDEYGMDKLREMGLTGMSETKGGLFKRPSKTYYFGQQGVPGQVDQQGMPVTPAAQIPGITGASGTGQDNSGDGMGWLARQFYKSGNKTGAGNRNIKRVSGTDADPLKFKSRFDPTGYNVDKSEVRNQLMQNRHRRLGDKLDALHTKDLSLKEQGFKGLGEKDKNKLERLQGRMDRIENNRMDAGNTSVSSFQKYTAPFVDRGTPTAMTPKGPTKLSSPRPFNFRDFLNYQDQNALSDAGMAPLNTIQSAPATAAGVNSQAQPPVSVNYPPTTRSTKPVMDFDPFGGNTVPDYIPTTANSKFGPNLFPQFNKDQDASALEDMLRPPADNLENYEFRKGGSYSAGDVVDMTPEEIQRFIEMGGQVEFLD